ncbi:MAG: protein-glutamate O-methyltransferase [Alphaproteobacteria bacterium]|nr:protein-glutamate O-methyltransferase [Alphaproteobacteria bacterium]
MAGLSTTEANESWNQEFSLGDDEFNFLAKLIYDRTGIVVGDNKRNLVYSRLARRIRFLKLGSFRDYCDLLGSAAGDDELPETINAVTTNLTKFFREDHHFDHLSKEVVPRLFSSARRRSKIRMWSAGCSSGQEPFSMAMTLADAVPDLSSWDAKILATDLDSNMIARCATGEYAEREIEAIPLATRKRFLTSDKDQGIATFKSDLRRLITFNQLNLLHQWPMKGPFDVIFFRNVVIYFDIETQRDILGRMWSLLADDGCLYVGHSENLSRVTDRFSLVGRTIYRKVL